MQCWPYFGDDKPISTANSANEVTGKTPQTLILLGQRINVETWRDVLIKTLNTIVDLEPERFETLVSSYTIQL